MYNFQICNVYKTIGISYAIENNENYLCEIMRCFERYLECDWGDLCISDKKENEKALKNNERLLGAYSTTLGKIFIITEWDRKTTTVMFANEY